LILSRDPRVFTIPLGAPFLPTLAAALRDDRILDGFGRNPAALAEATIYLPTRRAARAFAALLAAEGERRAQLLPRIVPLAEADDAEFELAGSDDATFEGAEALAPPIATLERRLILTGLIQLWAETVDRARLKLADGAPLLVPASPADAVGFAGDLERLMDGFATEDIPWDQLAEAVETDYSEYFGLTLDFVRIAAENWPKILAERGASDPARRRSALIHAEARRLLAERPDRPVIAAGSTGSMPATAALLNAIARLPNGAVVLPGLDHDLDEPSWTAIGGLETEDSDPVHGHPQATLRRLLADHLRVPRAAVRTLGSPPDSATARARMLSEALRPADTTDSWAAMDAEGRADLARHGAAGIKLIEAVDERDEALAAAIALRETLAVPNRTAALVTPDRALAKRVAAELARWGIAVEDSAGVPLSETRAGVAARLAADAAALDFHPIRLLALLAHPLVCLGLPRAAVARAASVLEIGLLRGPAPAPGLPGLRQALANGRGAMTRHTPRPRQRLTEGDWRLALDLVERLTAAFDGFAADAFGEHETDLVTVADAHRRTLDCLLEVPGNENDASDDNGSVAHLAGLFDDLALTEARRVRGRFVDYPAFFTTLAKERVTSPPARATHRRVKILGLLEARLLSVDRAVLGGLDEGVWPPRTETDAFLNRPMRARVGLAPPERRIGQTAHDFAQALGAEDVVVTRAQKRGGSPTVPSRFLQRIKAFVGDEVWREMLGAGERYLRLARTLETPVPARPLARPAPRPDPALFPRTLSVTEMETLVRDPYSIFARHILKLDALEPVAAAPSAAARGTIIHDILGGFAADYPTELPPRALEDLLQRGENAFGEIEDGFPELYAEWWPRFERLATEFVVWERKRRAEIAAIHAERSGALPITLPDGSVFTLRARADRIEARRDGRFAVIDFKTGAPPGLKEVFAGFSPQLTLEAAMLMEGGFKDVPAAPETPDLLYVHTSGGRQPLKPRAIETPRGDSRSVADVVAEHRRRLAELVGCYVSGKAAFLSRPYPKYAKRFSDYDHLARVKEWSLANAEGEEG
jgi:ATP-dependent helicase/nuclease subunit B